LGWNVTEHDSRGALATHNGADEPLICTLSPVGSGPLTDAVTVTAALGTLRYQFESVS
jgi:hypothetical protein